MNLKTGKIMVEIDPIYFLSSNKTIVMGVLNFKDTIYYFLVKQF